MVSVIVDPDVPSAQGERWHPEGGEEGMNILVEDLVYPILQQNRRKERPGGTMVDDFLSWLVREEELLPRLVELYNFR